MQQTAAIMDGLPIAHPFSAISKQVISFFNNNTRWISGSGSTIFLWNHNWGEGIMKDNLPNLFSFAIDTQITSRRVRIPQNSTTSLFRPNLSIEAQEELTLLCTLMRGVQLQHDQKDVIFWKGGVTGSFTVKSAYGLIKSGLRIKTTIQRIWKVEGPPRMKVFGWLVIRNSILMHDNLQKRMGNCEQMCVMQKRNGDRETFVLRMPLHTATV